MSKASVLVGAGCWVLGLLCVWKRQFTSLDLKTGTSGKDLSGAFTGLTLEAAAGRHFYHVHE